MKKLIFILISTLGFLLTSCTRSGNLESSKIQIKLPELKTSYSRKVGVLSTPTSLNDINCYMVFVGGPDIDLQRNTCPTKGNSVTGVPSRTISFGPLLGGFAPSSEISIEVPSGNDRVIHLVGMNVIAPELCRDFKTYGFPGKQESSQPFILGTVGRLLLEPSKTVEVPIAMTFDAANAIENCTGPDIPHNDDGGSDGGNSNEPYIRFEGLGKWNYPMNKDLGTVGQCYSVRPSLYVNGSPWIDPSMTNISVSVSSFNAGQFYSDSSCSTAVSSLEIPAGQSTSASNYYFKAPVPLNNVTLSGWTITGASVALQNSYQNVDFGYPRLTFSGPDKLPLNMCIKYKVTSEFFEGGYLNAPPGGLSVTLTDNASFYLRASSSCSTGTSVSIAPASSSADIYLKLMSPSPVGLENQVSAPGYNSSVFSVQNSLRGDYADAIKVLAKDNVIIRGECNPLTIRLVNFDGGAATAKNLMSLVFKAPQGAGSFYTLPDCSGAPINNIPLVVGNYELNIGFKANSLPLASLVAGKIPFQFHFGSIRIKDSVFSLPSDISFDVVEPYDPWFAPAHAPYFSGAEIVGSHEFNDGGSPSTFKYIPLVTNYTQLASIECSATPGSGFTACSAAEVDTSITPYRYKWSSANAASSTPRYVRFNFSSNGHTGNKEVKISGDVLYGNNFKVVQCGYIASVNESIESLSSTASGVVCLPANSIHARSTAQSFTFTSSTRTGLIGYSDLSSELNGSGQSGALVNPSSASSPDSNFYVANLRIRNFSASSQAVAINSISSSANYTAEFNNLDIDDLGTGSFQYLFSITTNSNLMNIKLRNSKIIASGSNNQAIQIMNAKNITLENNVIEANSAADAIYFYSSSSGGENILFNNLNVKTAGGHALYFSNASVPNGTNVIITNSRFRMVSPGSATNPVIKMTNKLISATFQNNIVETDPGVSNNHLMMIYNTIANQVSINMNSNTFLQGNPNKSSVYIDGGTNVDLSTLHDNAFVAAGGATNSYGFFELVTGSNVLNIFSGLTPTDFGANLSCSTTGINNFVVRHTLGAGAGLGGNFSITTIPLTANDSSLTSKRCGGP